MSNSYKLCRRSAIKRLAVAAAAAPLVLAGRTALAAKVPQSAAAYVDQTPNENNCAGCLHFEADAMSCKLVDGAIKAEGWCSFWVAKG